MEKVLFNQVVKVGCGIDVHKDNIVATIRKSEEDYETKEFSSFTGSLTELRDWCKTEGVTHIAMESTGVYWSRFTTFWKKAVLKSSLPMQVMSVMSRGTRPTRKTASG